MNKIIAKILEVSNDIRFNLFDNFVILETPDSEIKLTNKSMGFRQQLCPNGLIETIMSSCEFKEIFIDQYDKSLRVTVKNISFIINDRTDDVKFKLNPFKFAKEFLANRRSGDIGINQSKTQLYVNTPSGEFTINDLTTKEILDLNSYKLIKKILPIDLPGTITIINNNSNTVIRTSDFSIKISKSRISHASSPPHMTSPKNPLPIDEPKRLSVVIDDEINNIYRDVSRNLALTDQGGIIKALGKFDMISNEIVNLDNCDMPYIKDLGLEYLPCKYLHIPGREQKIVVCKFDNNNNLLRDINRDLIITNKDGIIKVLGKFDDETGNIVCPDSSDMEYINDTGLDCKNCDFMDHQKPLNIFNVCVFNNEYGMYRELNSNFIIKSIDDLYEIIGKFDQKTGKMVALCESDFAEAKNMGLPFKII